MARDAKTVAKYVIGGFGLVAMLALALFFRLRTNGAGLGSRSLHRRLARTLRARLPLDQTQATVGGAVAVDCRRLLAGRNECGCGVARLDTVTLLATTR